MKPSLFDKFWNFENKGHVLFLFPSFFKKLGVAIVFIAFITILVINNLLEQPLERENLINSLLYKSILIGVALISFSKDKYEDERIASLRFRSYSFALGLFIYIFVAFPFLHAISDYIHESKGFYDADFYDSSFFIILFILVSQLMYFYKFKTDL